MACRDCDSVKRQLAEALEELQAWRDYGREEPDDDSDARIAEICTLGLTPQQATMVATLEKREGKATTLASLINAISMAPGRKDRSEGAPSKDVLRAQLCKTRQRLNHLGVSIGTVYGVGYRMSTADVDALNKAIEAQYAKPTGKKKRVY